MRSRPQCTKDGQSSQSRPVPQPRPVLPHIAADAEFHECEAFSGPVLHGNYDIRRSSIEGKYHVTVQVHFVETDEAAGFYREMTAEINSGKNLQGPEMLEPGENGHPQDTGSQQKQDGDTQPNHPHSRQFEFEEMLSGSVNIRDFHISR